MIVEEAIGTRLFDEPPKREPCEITVADFDNVKLKVFVAPDRPEYVTVHISMGPIGERLKTDLYGAEILEEIYPGMSVTPDDGYHFAIGFDLDSPPMEKERLLRNVSCLRRNVLAAPITKALRGCADGTGGALPFMAIETRANEGLFIKPGNDRCVIVYAVDFTDETDKALARVMLQQFAKESGKINGAPPCAYAEAKNPPMEVAADPGVACGKFANGVGFLSFVVFQAHLKTPEKFGKSATMLTTFRNYLHYHIKASKTYLHMRMRKKVQGWLQILNRSHHEQEKEAKTASGKTFKRAVKSQVL